MTLPGRNNKPGTGGYESSHNKETYSTPDITAQSQNFKYSLPRSRNKSNSVSNDEAPTITSSQMEPLMHINLKFYD